MNSRFPVILVLALWALAGCVPEPPLPTCDVEPYVGTLVGPQARDCGSWDAGSAEASAAVDCVLEAIDAGEPFHYRINGIARPDFEEPQWAPYPVADFYLGQPDGGLSDVFFESTLGGRIELFFCDGLRVDTYEHSGRTHRQLRCNTVRNQRICSYQREHQERQQR